MVKRDDNVMGASLAMIAKAPVAGRVKTRLTPPCTPGEAAALAEAALADTLAAMRAAVTPGRRVVVLDGEPGNWTGADVEVIPQRGGGLDERLAAAFADLDGPALIVGMDTPQVTPALLDRALGALEDHDAVLGAADDGGYWCIGLRAPDPGALLGVPMSVATTGASQRERLAALGLDFAEVDNLRDVDDFESACAVAAAAPDTHFARCLSGLRVAA